MKNAAFAAAVLIGLAVSAAAAAQPRPDVAFPDGYRSWVHIKSGWIGEGSPAFPHFGGMHHIYANAKAMAGYRAKSFSKGSVLVFDVLATRAGPGSLDTAERRIRDVMEKSADGWRFTEFNGDSHAERTLTAEATLKTCAACHATSKTGGAFAKVGDAAR